MSGSQFIPSTSRTVEQVPSPMTEYQDVHGLSSVLLSVAQYALVALVAFLPLFFVPRLFGTLGFSKVLLVLTLSVVVIATVSLVGLRRRQIATVLPKPLGVFWLVVVVALLSALLSGDTLDAIRGTTFETQTVGFLAVMGLLMTTPLILQGSKLQSMKVLAGFGISGAFLLLYVLARFVFGAEFLAFNSFGSLTVSPLGSFNDLALFSGLVVIMSLITLAQLPVRGWMQYGIAGLLLAALVMLCIVNFFNIWIVLGFVALLLFMYLIARDTLFAAEGAVREPVSKLLILLTAIVCVTSTLFIVSGGSLGAKMGQLTGVDYVEVRPSFSATTDIVRAVYSENAFLGVGPNRFADAWRMHKDNSINQTIFWDTDFNSGNGFVSTFFVNNGILGGLLLIVFHIWFAVLGYRMLLRTQNTDRFWYYFGLLSFSAAVFIWGMSYVYVPGPTILLLAAFFTGCTFAASGALLPASQHKIALASNQRRGFILMSVIIVLITGSISALYAVGEQYVAEARFNEAQVTATDVTQFETTVQQAYDMYPDDRFVRTRAQIQLAKLNALLNVQDATEEQQQQFLQTAPLAIEYGEAAVRADNTNPDNYAVLGSIYSALAAAGVQDTRERANLALNEAKRLDPQNPVHYLVEAQLAARDGDVEAARAALVQSLNLKRNFTEALFLATQLDISEGNIESAIATTRAIISLEPNNPTRYYQLGILLAANNQVEEAIVAHERALQLDPQYANARYMLALGYLNTGREAEALTELQKVAETNPNNEQLETLIGQIESGNYELPSTDPVTPPVAESSTVTTEDDTVVTDGDVDTDLLTPVNTISDTAPDAATETAPAETAIETTTSTSSTE